MPHRGRGPGEGVTFPLPSAGHPLLDKPAAPPGRNWNALEATFYAHAKGVSPKFANRPDELRSVRRWRNLMYRANLEIDVDFLDDKLRRYIAVGCLRYHGQCRQEDGRPPSWWHFAGTFFWINHAQYFWRPDALTLGPSRWAVERHLGEITPISETYCIVGDHVPPSGIYSWPDEKWEALERELDRLSRT